MTTLKEEKVANRRADNIIRKARKSIKGKEDKVKVVEPRKKRVPKVKKKTQNKLISLDDLCKELKVSAGKARGRLRKADINKPYMWSKVQAEEIKKLLK